MSRYKIKPGHYHCPSCGYDTEDGWVTKGTERKHWSRTGAMFDGYSSDVECPNCRSKKEGAK